MTRIAVIIPDRNDRPHFTANCIRQLEAQTLKPHILCHKNYDPESDDYDITQRYRRGYEELSQRDDVDLIAFMENDDWYSADYLATMVKYWKSSGRPQVFGLNHSIYYHLRLGKWMKMQHPHRADNAQTLILPRLEFDWCPDNEPFTDVHIWKKAIDKNTGKRLQCLTFSPPHPIHIGFKHGFGKCGTQSHTSRFNRFTQETQLLKETLDPDSLTFFLKAQVATMTAAQPTRKIQRKWPELKKTQKEVAQVTDKTE